MSEVVHQVDLLSESGLFKNLCLICNQQFKKKYCREKEHLVSLTNHNSAEKIKQAAQALNDHHLLAVISDIDLVAKQAKVHNSCRNAYLKKVERLIKFDLKSCSSQCLFKDAYETLKTYVQNEVIDCGRPEKLLSLYERYCNLCKDTSPPYKPQYLCDKLITDFNGVLQVCKSSKKEGLVLYSIYVSADFALKQEKFENNFLQEAALYLRKAILSQELQDLPETLTAQSIKNGQHAVPNELQRFFSILYTGCDNNENLSTKTSRLINSVCNDVVFAVSRGKIKPGKHLSLGLGIKSLTGSRRIVEVLNRFGHCVSYHIVEEIETQFASEITSRDKSTPDGLFTEPGLITSLAWDNYDENVETLSGAGTLHDTVGICYQIVPENDSRELNSVDVDMHMTTSNTVSVDSNLEKSRRSLEHTERLIEPYRKKPKMSSFHYEVHECTIPDNLKQVQMLDYFWMMLFSMNKHTPLWAGWNSLATKDDLPLQRIGYMENINFPPTRLDVVAETLRQSQKVARECGEESIIVTYDLAIAKPAMQIQAQEAPLFDNVFICFGAFHILMTYFNSIGYFIDGSGGPEVLTESQVLAAGSLNTFIRGKQYNRCKRLHVILASAFKSLHFEKFLELYGPIPEAVHQAMEIISAHPSPEELEQLEMLPSFCDFMEKYEMFCNLTVQGEHGSTAKFWFTYIEFVLIFLRFQRASRTNDLDLFIHSLNEMCSIFFATNKPNYSRWMVKYSMNLTNASPSVRQKLENGALSIRRTIKNFSRTEVDLTLEQTINADAASRLTGITSFSSSTSARKRWMLTRSVRSEVVGGLLEMVDLKEQEDVSKFTRPHRINKDQEDFRKVVDLIKSTMNPFDIDPSQSLFCITTGKQTSIKVQEDLLHCYELGSNWKQEFLSDCVKDASVFEKPLKRRKIKNFTTDAVKTKLSSKQQKVVEIQNTRDIFGRLLLLSTEQSVDLQLVFQFPLLSVPLSLAHVDGSIKKTDKSKLMHKIEQFCTGPPPERVDVTLVDAMFFLHTLQYIPKTFGKLSSRLLSSIASMSSTVHFICDVYKQPSIKDVERDRRGKTETSFCITGPEQKLPNDWQACLKNVLFKKSLFQFLAEDWKHDRHAVLLQDHDVYLALESSCLCFSVRNGKTVSKQVPEYNCCHEEADTRLIFHLCQAITKNPELCYVVRSNDTDVLVLLLYHTVHSQSHCLVWMDAGLSIRNNRRYIPVFGAINKPFTSDLSKLMLALPGFHAFTGSDFTAAFSNKGKLRPFEILKKDNCYLNAFVSLGDVLPTPVPVVEALEKFVCHMYGCSSKSGVDQVRYEYFKRTYSIENTRSVTSKLKGLDPACMPPCKKVLDKKIERANFVSTVWKNAFKLVPVIESPLHYGWIQSLDDENRYDILWFDGLQLPIEIFNILVSNDQCDLTSVDEEDDTSSIHNSDDSNDDSDLDL